MRPTNATIGAGVDVALYDLTPDHLAPEPASFRRVLESGVAAVVVSPLFGVPVQWEPLEDEFPAIEDPVTRAEDIFD